MLGVLVVPYGLSFPAGRTGGPGETGPEEGQCGQRLATSLTLVKQSVSVSVVQGVLRLSPVFWDSLNGALFLNSSSCSYCEGE